MDTHLPTYWAEKVLHVLGAPLNHENLRFLHAWAKAEGGISKFNPLNTTYPLAWGSPPLAGNTAGVRDYSQPVGGICATILTLATSHNPDGKLTYGGIVGDLQAGTKKAEEIVHDRYPQIKTWGTTPEHILTVLEETP